MCFCLRVILLAFRLFIILLRYLSLPYLYQISTDLLHSFFENARIIISDITAFLEYFILAGELSYIDRRCVGRQNSSSCSNKWAILYQFNQSLFQHDCRIILYISALLELFFFARGTSPFSHRRHLYLKKRI